MIHLLVHDKKDTVGVAVGQTTRSVRIIASYRYSRLISGSQGKNEKYR